MPWRRSERLKPPSSPHPIPDFESVRRAALAASWRRDRRISQRRLAWRWALWYVGRYHLQILGILAALLLVAWLMQGMLLAGKPQVAGNPVTEGAAAPHVPDVAQSTQPMPVWPAPSLVPATVYSGLPDPELSGLPLRLVPQLGWQEPLSGGREVQTPQIESAEKSANPSLITETWLHSKEP